MLREIFWEDMDILKWDIFYLEDMKKIIIKVYVLLLNPERIILGGGVMKQRQLFPLVREELRKLIAGYVKTPNLDEYIVQPTLEDNAGIIGCLLLAVEANK